MKYFVIILVLVGFLGSFLFWNHAYALWFSLSPEELIEQSGTIFVGTVTDVTPVEVEYQSQIARNGTIKQSVGPEIMALEEYTVGVEEFLKNPQDSDTMKVLRATVSGVPSGPSKISGFEVGDRVLFYLPKDEKQTHFPGQYLPESFKIPKSCDAKTVLEQSRIQGGVSFKIMQKGEGKRDNFTADMPIQFVYEKDTRTLFGKSLDVYVGISKKTSDKLEIVFEKDIHVGSNLCEWMTSAEWTFTPEKGDYRMYVSTEEDDNRSAYEGGFSVILEPTHNVIDTIKQNGFEPISDNVVLLDGNPFFISQPHKIQSIPDREMLFHGVSFTLPYVPMPPTPGGIRSTTVVFPDGHSEVLSRGVSPTLETTMSKHLAQLQDFQELQTILFSF